MKRANSTNKIVSVDLQKSPLYLETQTEISSFRRRQGHRHYLNLIKKYHSKKVDISLLDIGTGSGSFLHYINGQREFENLSGVEYDNRLVAQCNANVKDGICVQGNAEEFFINKKFDVITSFQVIEHLYDPNSFLNNISEHLRENGILILTTPNLDSVAHKTLGAKWHGHRKDHVNLYKFEEFSSALAQQGFQTLYQGSTFFSGVPVLNKLPAGIINWALLYAFGSLPWKHGEAIVGVYKK